MNAPHLQLFTTIRPRQAAAVTVGVVHIRLNRAAAAGLHVGYSRTDGDYLHAEFMSGDTRVTEKRHLAQVAADVGAANADSMHADQRLACAGLAGGIDFNALN